MDMGNCSCTFPLYKTKLHDQIRHHMNEIYVAQFQEFQSSSEICICTHHMFFSPSEASSFCLSSIEKQQGTRTKRGPAGAGTASRLAQAPDKFQVIVELIFSKLDRSVKFKPHYVSIPIPRVMGTDFLLSQELLSNMSNTSQTKYCYVQRHRPSNQG